MNDALIYFPRRRAISLTALIDVVFILLLFFMLTSTFTHWKAVDFQFPVASPDLSTQEPQALILHQDGSLSLHGQPFHLPTPNDPIPRRAGAFDVARPVVVFPEANTRVQMIISAFEELQAAGIAGVSLGKSLDQAATN